MKAIQHLRELSKERFRRKFPHMPEHCVTSKSYSDRTANGLTKCIIDFLRYTGAQAERISNTGRMIDRRQTVTDVIGRVKTIGSYEWVYGSGTRGTADISATVKGRSVKIEVKIGSVRQSEYQKQYQNSIEKSGGLYYIARTFETFIDWYCSQFKISEPFTLAPM